MRRAWIADAKTLTQTFRFKFLYVTDSTLNPIVGIVVTTSPIYRATGQNPGACPKIIDRLS